MCCCLSTLRRFVKHFAPRLLGEGSSNGDNSKTHSRGFSRNAGQRTFGSGGAKRTLDTLMHTHNGDNGIPLSSFDDMDKNGTKVNMGRDSDSEEAILFERTVQVTYEDRDKTSHHDGDCAGGFSVGRALQPKIWTGNRSS
jgi:hypothetical protein